MPLGWWQLAFPAASLRSSVGVQFSYQANKPDGRGRPSYNTSSPKHIGHLLHKSVEIPLSYTLVMITIIPSAHSALLTTTLYHTVYLLTTLLSHSMYMITIYLFLLRLLSDFAVITERHLLVSRLTFTS